MATPVSKTFLDFLSFVRSAHLSASPDRCLIAPSPELRERIRQEMDTLRSSTSGVMVNMLKVRDVRYPGMNDGLIYPGDTFPLGTSLGVVREAAVTRSPLRGSVRVIVALVQFSDVAIHQSQAHFEELFFSMGVLPNGSVREYFHEVTNGLVDIVGEVVGPYTLARTQREYAHGASGTGLLQPNARTMAFEAANAANTKVDFAPYDNDQDGFVDAFIVIHAGKGAESTGSVDDLWSHKWVLSGGAYDADGTKVYAYLTVPEDARIGVCCHELGHLLFGFPDLYDTDYSSEGVGNWCLMGGGSWNGGGEVPAHPSAWCKLVQGWVDVITPNRNEKIQISDVKSGRKIYKLWKDGNPQKEYFLLENRQQTHYDRFLPASGLILWHVDDAIPTNSDESHPKVALVQADGRRDLENGLNRGEDGDPFPGRSMNTSFGDGTTPGSKSYGDLNTCVSITEISPSAAVMSVRVMVSCGITSTTSSWENLKTTFGEYIKKIKDAIFPK